MSYLRSYMLFAPLLLTLLAAVPAGAAEVATAPSQLLFEPQPLPAAEASAPAFTPFDPALRAARPASAETGTRAEQLAAHQQQLDAAVAAAGEGSPAAAEAYLAFADWNLQVFIDESTIAQSVTHMDSARFASMRNSSPLGGTAGELAAMQDGGNQLQSTLYNLFLARNNYLKALSLLLQANDPANPALLPLERRFQTTLLLSMHRDNVLYDPDFFLTRRSSATGTRLNTSAQTALTSDEYQEGVTSFSRALEYVDRNKARTAEQIVSTLLEEADWDLMFARGKQASDKYDAAFQFFEANDVVKTRAAALIDPATPVTLPAFMSAPNSRQRLGIAADAPVHWLGWFDVSFEVRKNGRAAGIKLLDRAGNVDEAMEQRLREVLGKSLFRPRYQEGKLSDTPYRLRYYIGF